MTTPAATPGGVASSGFRVGSDPLAMIAVQLIELAVATLACVVVYFIAAGLVRIMPPGAARTCNRSCADCAGALSCM